MRSEWKRMISLSIFGGIPNFSSTENNPSRGTLSKALTRSMKTAQVLSPCSCLFWSAILTVKIPSQHPLCRMKPFCSSRPSGSKICSWILFAIIALKILEGDSISMMPLQLSRIFRSPFFGTSLSRFESHSSSQSPVSHTWRQISQKRLSVDSSSAKICQNSTGIFESPAALSFLAALSALRISSRVGGASNSDRTGLCSILEKILGSSSLLMLYTFWKWSLTVLAFSSGVEHSSPFWFLNLCSETGALCPFRPCLMLLTQSQ